MDLNGYFSFQPPPIPDSFHSDLMDEYLLSYTTISDGSFSAEGAEFSSDLSMPSYHSQGPIATNPGLQDFSIAPQDSFQFHPGIVDQYLFPYPTVSGDLFSTQGAESLPDLAAPPYDPQGSSAVILASSMNQSHRGEGRDPFGSDEVPGGDFDDQSYRPSPTSSLLSNGQWSPFSYSPDESLRGSSEPTSLDEETPNFPQAGNRTVGTRNDGSRRKTKDKAKGSAALALAKLTLKNNKPLIGPYGTFVPYPTELVEGSDVIARSGEETTSGLRHGRKRRNGHIPSPVIVPDLIKKSRGRKVPSRSLQDGAQSGDGRQFVCKVKLCGSTFGRNEHLKRHISCIHTNEKKYICPEPSCSRAFNRRDNLAQHARVHLTDADS